MLTINFSAGATVYASMLTTWGKTLTHTPVTKTVSNNTGQETLTEGTAASIKAPFFVQEDEYNQDFAGLMESADAILLLDTTSSVSKDDKITYSSQDYRVHSVRLRELNGTAFYKVARCFKI